MKLINGQAVIESTSDALTAHLAAGSICSHDELKGIIDDIEALTEVSEANLPLTISVEATAKVIKGLRELATTHSNGQPRNDSEPGSSGSGVAARFILYDMGVVSLYDYRY